MSCRYIDKSKISTIFSSTRWRRETSWQYIRRERRRFRWRFDTILERNTVLGAHVSSLERVKIRTEALIWITILSHKEYIRSHQFVAICKNPWLLQRWAAYNRHRTVQQVYAFVLWSAVRIIICLNLLQRFSNLEQPCSLCPGLHYYKRLHYISDQPVVVDLDVD